MYIDQVGHDRVLSVGEWPEEELNESVSRLLSLLPNFPVTTHTNGRDAVESLIRAVCHFTDGNGRAQYTPEGIWGCLSGSLRADEGLMRVLLGEHQFDNCVDGYYWLDHPLSSNIEIAKELIRKYPDTVFIQSGVLDNVTIDTRDAICNDLEFLREICRFEIASEELWENSETACEMAEAIIASDNEYWCLDENVVAQIASVKTDEEMEEVCRRVSLWEYRECLQDILRDTCSKTKIARLREMRAWAKQAQL